MDLMNYTLQSIVIFSGNVRNFISDTISDVYNANIEDLHGLNFEANQ